MAARETYLQAAQASKEAAASWRLVTWLIVGGTVLGAVMWDMRRGRY